VIGHQNETTDEKMRKDLREGSGTYLTIEDRAEEGLETAMHFKEVVGIARRAQLHLQRRKSLRLISQILLVF
jgi:hypothetical protein